MRMLKQGCPPAIFRVLLGFFLAWTSIPGHAARDVDSNSGKDPGFIKLEDLMAVIKRKQDIPGDDVYVTTKYGELRGKRKEGYRKAGGLTRTVDWFLGVPYAGPPTGNSRFKPPKAPEPWTELRNATQFGWACPQDQAYPHTSPDTLDEDCLNLNIYSPVQSDTPDARYPVLVFFHGGSYRVGAGSIYLGHVLAQYGVVVVTVNYRLGFLGFICARDKNLPGNYGILDQIESLKWIRENIGAFRGDPGRVTISGNSAGGSSVGLLSISPPAAGLFTQVIVQSGSILGFWAAHNETVDLRSQTNQIAGLMGCARADTADMSDCMKKVHWKDIPPNYKFARYSPTDTNLKPCLDDYVMPRMPRDLLADGRIHVTAAMTGVVDNEWGRNIGWLFDELLKKRPDLDQDYHDGVDRQSFVEIIDHVITSRFGWDQAVAEAVTYEYTNWTTVTDPSENRQQYINFMTDYGIVAPTVELARLYNKRGVAVHFYDFDHTIQFDNSGPDWKGTYHTMELNFIFGAPFYGLQLDDVEQQPYTAEDETVSKRVMAYWSNFVRSGDPSQAHSSVHINDTGLAPWTPFTDNATEYIYISANVTEMRSHFRAKRVAFWNDFLPQLQQGLHSDVTENQSDKSFKTEMLGFIVISTVLFVLLILSLIYIVHIRSTRRLAS